MAFNAAADARRLREAMKGIGTNDSVLIDVISHRTREQRLMISAEYNKSFSRDLLKDLESETSGNYRLVLLLLMKPRDVMLAELLHEAMAGAGTKDLLLIDIITQFPYELPAVAATYQRLYGKSLEAVIKSETSGDYEKLLCALLNTPRPLPNVVDASRAAADAEAFYRAGEGKIGTNEGEYIRIVSTSSYQQLTLIDQAYRTAHKKGLEAAIKSETSGHFKDAMLSLVTAPSVYFAHRIQDAVEGAGTNDIVLITAFVANERPQLQAIAESFHRLFSKPMSKRVGDDISGDYKRILLALL